MKNFKDVLDDIKKQLLYCFTNYNRLVDQGKFGKENILFLCLQQIKKNNTEGSTS